MYLNSVTFSEYMNFLPWVCITIWLNYLVKFEYSEKATKFEKIFHLKCDSVTSIFKWKIFFQILWPSQNMLTLKGRKYNT